MNKEQILERIKLLEQERANTMSQSASLNSMYDGAIQDCNYWLQKLNETVQDTEEKE